MDPISPVLPYGSDPQADLARRVRSTCAAIWTDFYSGHVEHCNPAQKDEVVGPKRTWSRAHQRSRCPRPAGHVGQSPTPDRIASTSCNLKSSSLDTADQVSSTVREARLAVFAASRHDRAASTSDRKALSVSRRMLIRTAQSHRILRRLSDPIIDDDLVIEHRDMSADSFLLSLGRQAYLVVDANRVTGTEHTIADWCSPCEPESEVLQIPVVTSSRHQSVTGKLKLACDWRARRKSDSHDKSAVNDLLSPFDSMMMSPGQISSISTVCRRAPRLEMSPRRRGHQRHEYIGTSITAR